MMWLKRNLIARRNKRDIKDKKADTCLRVSAFLSLISLISDTVFLTTTKNHSNTTTRCTSLIFI